MIKNINNLKQEFKKQSNQKDKIEMEAYLKNQFVFIGLRKPKRSIIEKDFIKFQSQKSADEVLKIAFELHYLNEREYMYTAQILLYKKVKDLKFKHIIKIIELTKVNSWWENTDGYNTVIKKWLLLNPQYIDEFVNTFYDSENIWLKRISIICQLAMKEKTNQKALEKAIKFSLNDNEFFVQKAIGWSLREYSKNNPQYVLKFIDNNNLTPFAQKEALKIINKGNNA